MRLCINHIYNLSHFRSKVQSMLKPFIPQYLRGVPEFQREYEEDHGFRGG